MKLGFGWSPVTDAAAALKALLRAITALPLMAIVFRQKVGVTVFPAPATPAPPATEVPEAMVVGHVNGLAAPPAHTKGVKAKTPLGIRPGLSKSTLFQMEFS